MRSRLRSPYLTTTLGKFAHRAGTARLR
jgi:hypothetical protein